MTRSNAHSRKDHQISSFQEYLRQIVYGGNDGIVTTFAVVAGFAGFGAEGAAEVGAIAVLLFGIANLLADGTAMGLGEFLSARAHKDVFQAARARELVEIRAHPEAERDEAAALLTDKGVSPADASALAELFLRNPEFMADFMMQHETGISDPLAEVPGLNGLATFVSFLLFGSIPLIPYILWDAKAATFYWSCAATAAALTALGLLRWRVSQQGMARAVGETVLVGGTCAIVAFAVGLAFR